MSPVHWLLDAVLSHNSSARNSSSHRGRSLHTKVGFYLDDNNYRIIMPIMLMSDHDYWLWLLWCLGNFSQRRIQYKTEILHNMKKWTNMMPLVMSTLCDAKKMGVRVIDNDITPGIFFVCWKVMINDSNMPLNSFHF